MLRILIGIALTAAALASVSCSSPSEEPLTLAVFTGSRAAGEVVMEWTGGAPGFSAGSTAPRVGGSMAAPGRTALASPGISGSRVSGRTFHPNALASPATGCADWSRATATPSRCDPGRRQAQPRRRSRPLRMLRRQGRTALSMRTPTLCSNAAASSGCVGRPTCSPYLRAGAGRCSWSWGGAERERGSHWPMRNTGAGFRSTHHTGREIEPYLSGIDEDRRGGDAVLDRLLASVRFAPEQLHQPLVPVTGGGAGELILEWTDGPRTATHWQYRWRESHSSNSGGVE